MLSPRRGETAAGRNVRDWKTQMYFVGACSLYTSVIPNLLVTGVAEAIENPKQCASIYRT